jgi:hypothetical protein
LPEQLAKDVGGKGFRVTEVHRIFEKRIFLHGVECSPETGRHLIRLADRNDVISDRVGIDCAGPLTAASALVTGH